MAAEGIRSPKISMNPRKRTPPSAETGTKENILSPRFRSVAAMAGWDEEALLLASLVVEDTPVRESRRKKRPIQFKSPPSTNSTRKRMSHRPTSDAIPPIVLHLDDDADVDEVAVKKEISKKIENVEGGGVNEEKKVQREGASDEKAAGKGLACIDRLREELSCAICLDICFEPSTTPCGHSFCMKCLKCAAAKCGKRCPKCRQLISIGRACTVNTVLWNTIQLLFPEEVEEKKKAIPANSCSRETGSKSSNTTDNIRIRRNDVRSAMRSSSSRSSTQAPRAMDNYRTQAPRATDNYRTQAPRAMDNYRSIRRSVGPPSQSEDAALALRLQREEFMEAFQDNREQQRNTGGNLRSIASRAMYIRSRGR